MTTEDLIKQAECQLEALERRNKVLRKELESESPKETILFVLGLCLIFILGALSQHVF